MMISLSSHSFTVPRCFVLSPPSFLSIPFVDMHPGRLHQLEELHLDCNNLTSLPSSIGACKNLMVLNLSDNMLVGLPSEMSELFELRTLNCKNNKIIAIPDSIFRSCTKLGNLNLMISYCCLYLSPLFLCTHWSIVTCPVTTYPLSDHSIPFFYFRTNCFHLFHLCSSPPHCHTLILFHTRPNQIESIERIHFSGNLLRNIPETIGGCTRAIVMDFSTNVIEELPSTLAQCVNVEILLLGSNKIPSIPPEIFSNLLKLREVQLFKNKITVVSKTLVSLHYHHYYCSYLVHTVLLCITLAPLIML